MYNVRRLLKQKRFEDVREKKATLWPYCDDKVAMLKRDSTTTRISARQNRDLAVLIEQQAQMFERIAARLESMDSRLERLIGAFESARNVSSQHF